MISFPPLRLSSAQACADPLSLFYPKPGWEEETAPFAFRIVLSADEARLLQYQAERWSRPTRNAYIDFVQRELNTARGL